MMVVTDVDVLEMVRSLDLSIPVVVAATTARRSPLIVSSTSTAALARPCAISPSSPATLASCTRPVPRMLPTRSSGSAAGATSCCSAPRYRPAGAR